MEGISFDNVELDETFLEDPSIFTTESEEASQTQTDNNNLTEVDVNDLFTLPESVGEEEDTQGQEDSSTDEGGDPKVAKGLYSSIASALKAERILTSIENDNFDDIKTTEDFVALFNKEIESRLSEEHKRIKTALDAGMEPTEIDKFEKTLKFLETISEDTLSEETPEAETLRKQLIYQDYVNRGFAHAKAVKEVDKTIAAGTDIEDALEALTTNKEFYSTKYQSVINSQAEIIKAEKQRIKDEGEALKKLVETTDTPFKNVTVDAVTKSLILKNLSVADVKGEDGQYRTPLQNYQVQNPQEFLYKLGALYTLTDGFKDFEKIIKPTVKKATNTSLRELENMLKNTRVNQGNLNFVGSADIQDDTESYSGVTLDI